MERLAKRAVELVPALVVVVVAVLLLSGLASARSSQSPDQSKTDRPTSTAGAQKAQPQPKGTAGRSGEGSPFILTDPSEVTPENAEAVAEKPIIIEDATIAGSAGTNAFWVDAGGHRLLVIPDDFSLAGDQPYPKKGPVKIIGIVHRWEGPDKMPQQVKLNDDALQQAQQQQVFVQASTIRKPEPK